MLSFSPFLPLGCQGSPATSFVPIGQVLRPHLRTIPPSSSIEKHCVLPPILCTILSSRHNAYTSHLPYYIGPPSTSTCRCHFLLYLAIAPPFSLQCHPACHAPPFSPSLEVYQHRHDILPIWKAIAATLKDYAASGFLLQTH